MKFSLFSQSSALVSVYVSLFCDGTENVLQVDNVRVLLVLITLNNGVCSSVFKPFIDPGDLSSIVIENFMCIVPD